MSDKGAARRRVLFVGSTRYDLPLSPALERKWTAVARRLDLRVIARAGAVDGSDPRFNLVSAATTPAGRAAFYASLPLRVAAEARRFNPDVIVAQSPFESLGCLRPGRARPRLIVELHADWRAAAGLYGSRWRRPFAGLAHRAGAYALKRADGVRAVSPFTADLAQAVTGEPPLASFPAYIDFESFVAEELRPLPDRPAIAWIGALEGPKAPELIADAWRRVGRSVPDARLVLLGRGRLQHVVDRLVGEFPDQVRSVEWMEPLEVARLLDDSTALAMSSRSEGLGRVIMEAFLRGRPVVAPAVGGVASLVKSERNGILVEPGDPDQLAEAMLRVLRDRELAQRLADGAREDARHQLWSAEGYADSVSRMVDNVLA